MLLSKAIEKWQDNPTYKEPSTIHWFVWLLENPKSPISLTGAIDLYNHDIIHILLDRGMLNRDEAMVIGFTMGNSETTSSWVRWLFEFCARYLYPESYRFKSMICWNLREVSHMDIPDQNEIYILQNLMSKEMLKKYEKNGE